MPGATPAALLGTPDRHTSTVPDDENALTGAAGVRDPVGECVGVRVDDAIAVVECVSEYECRCGDADVDGVPDAAGVGTVVTAYDSAYEPDTP